MSRMYRIAIPLLGVWLIVWIAISWPAVQDDALIHLRYADNLYQHHFITYDGVHPNYGASSLLYVAVLALLRSLSASPNLPRAVSSVVHLLLFSGLALAFSLCLPKSAHLARLTALLLLVLLVTPSAIRWLDDGMETGLVLSVVSSLAWLIHRQSVLLSDATRSVSRTRYLPLALLSFIAVMLRTELLLVCATGFVILALISFTRRENLASIPGSYPGRILAVSGKNSHLVLGVALAFTTIYSTMHVLLPDTAIAKSHGIGKWFHPIHDTALTLGGAFSFGIGMLLFWLLTLGLVALHCRRPSANTLMANSLCPVVLALSSLRGQEIQGVRYFAWTFFFSIIWNVLELTRTTGMPVAAGQSRFGAGLVYAFAVLLCLELPFEAIAMKRVLTARSNTMREFASQHLKILQARRGIASDIGYIAYFSGASICDLAGLVNGRAAARLTGVERASACLRTTPDFVFANASQLIPLARMVDLSQWQVCGRYDFTNVRTPDTHYLVVRAAIAADVCQATTTSPMPVTELLPVTL